MTNDAGFALAYAVIMLNTDQHNNNVRKQNIPMTIEVNTHTHTQFISHENTLTIFIFQIYFIDRNGLSYYSYQFKFSTTTKQNLIRSYFVLSWNVQKCTYNPHMLDMMWITSYDRFCAMQRWVSQETLLDTLHLVCCAGSSDGLKKADPQ